MRISYLNIRRLLAVCISVFLIVLAFWSTAFEQVLWGLAGFPLWAGTSMLALLLANLFLVSFRFWKVLAHFGIALPWKVAWRASLAGNLAGLFVIPWVGQIMGRQSVLQSFDVQPLMNASFVAYERTLLALISGVLATLGGFFLFGQTANARIYENIALAEIVIAACGGGALSLWLGGSRFERKLFGQLLSRGNLICVIQIAALTFVGQLLILGCFVLGILAVNPTISVLYLFAASAIISLAASMPITIGGWGAREVVAVYVLGSLGITPTDALTVSVMVGLCSSLVILASSPFYIISKLSHV